MADMLPPRLLEKLFNFLIPPAAREHVLGDLAERCTSPLSYVFDALSVLPWVLFGRIRRATDLATFLTETLTVFVCFTGAAWLCQTPSALFTQSTLIRLAVPAALAAATLLGCNAYLDANGRSVYASLLQSLAAIFVAALVEILLRTLDSTLALPMPTLLYGSLFSALLLSPVRFLSARHQIRPR